MRLRVPPVVWLPDHSEGCEAIQRQSSNLRGFSRRKEGAAVAPRKMTVGGMPWPSRLPIRTICAGLRDMSRLDAQAPVTRQSIPMRNEIRT
jgi:hypothetical protein